MWKRMMIVIKLLVFAQIVYLVTMTVLPKVGAMLLVLCIVELFGVVRC